MTVSFFSGLLPSAEVQPKAKSRRGFASMTLEQRKQIASMGGKRAHEIGRAHQFTSDEARAAGRKGAESRSAARKAEQEQSA